MEFNFIINKLIQLDSQGIGIYSSKTSRNRGFNQTEQQLSTLINTMGEKSAIAQGLKQIITHYDKISGTDQRMYIVAEGRTCQGFIKVGMKNLFYRDMVGNVKEIKPLCVLDFYVHESCQRQGYGKILFEYMLQYEKITPEKLAYDRPSPKLIAFLKKHYNLCKYISQNNNFVVFDQYFTSSNNNSKQSNQNPRSFSQPYADFPPASYGSQQQQQSNNKAYPYKQENIQETLQHSSSRNNKEFVNAGRAILSKEEIYKKESLNHHNQQNIENSLNMVNNSHYSMKSQQPMQQQQPLAYAKDPYLNKFDNQWADKNVKKPPLGNDRELDKIQQKIQQTEKELAAVNQQIIRQRHNLSHDPLSSNQQAQNIYNTDLKSSPWAQTGFNYYQTSSSNYGNHYTYYKK